MQSQRGMSVITLNILQYWDIKAHVF